MADTKSKRRFVVRLAEAQDNLCFYCQTGLILLDPNIKYDMDFGNRQDVASYDHVVPRIRGGRGGDNIVIAHRGCNSSKNKREPTAEEIERLRILNLKRVDIFTPDHGQISPATFGIVSPSGITLADILNNLEDNEDNAKLRHRVCRTISNYNKKLSSLNHMKNPDDWFYFATFAKVDFLQKVSEQFRETELIKTYVENILMVIFNDRRTRISNTDRRNQ